MRAVASQGSIQAEIAGHAAIAGMFERMTARKFVTAAVAVTAIHLAAPSLVATVRAAPLNPRLAQVHTWAFAIGDGTLAGDLQARYTGFDLVIVDGEAVTASQVRALHTTGALVLGYLDVGGIERGRWWFQRARRYRLDYWPDWGEWYANVAAHGYRSLLAKKVAPRMLHKSLDGLFLDNVDMIDTHPEQKRGMGLIVKRLARLVHRRKHFLFAQNGEAVIGPMLGDLDGWNREDLGYTYNFQTQSYERVLAAETIAVQMSLRHIAGTGLLTLATSYTDGSAAENADAVRLACAAGALPFASDIELTRIGPPLSCG